MNTYVTGAIIRRIREERKMTQQDLAARLSVSEKTVSKWETGKGYPDIAILEDLAAALSISVIELLSGRDIINSNRAGNMAKARIYVCPICGNVLAASGEAMVSCCGVVLLPLEAEKPDEAHTPVVEQVEDEYFVSFPHEMTKQHYISFIASPRWDGIEIVKLYPEGGAEARFKRRGSREIWYCCNRDGFFRYRLR